MTCRQPGKAQQCFHLTCEQEYLAVGPPVKRLDTEVIANKKQSPAGLVKNRKRKYSLQSFRELRYAPLLVTVNQYFGIGPCAKAMSQRGKLCAQRQVVVDLAVEDCPYAAVLVRNRLIAGMQVNDRQAPVTEPTGFVGGAPFTTTIGPAMLECVEHPGGYRRGQRRLLLGSQPQISGDSTHCFRKSSD